MKKLFVPFLILSLVFSAYSQWVSNFGVLSQGDVNFTNAKGNAVTADVNGNSYVTGKSFEGSNYDDIITIKYNPGGDTAWVRSYNGTASLSDEGFGICVDNEGNVFVVGATNNTLTGNDLIIIKYNQDGVMEWGKSFSTESIDKTDKGLAIAVDAEGYIYVTGYTTYADNIQQILTQKYDQVGNRTWSKVHKGNGGVQNNGNAIAISNTGDIYVTGFITNSGTGNDIVILKYDTEGTVLWDRSVNGTSNSEDKAWGIVVDDEGDAYIAGWTTDQYESRNCFTSKYNSDGSVAWTKKYNGGGSSFDKAWGIVVDTDESVFITGESNNDYITIKYDPTGSEVWVQTYNGTGDGTDISSAIGLVTSPSNERCIAITGKSWGTNYNYDYATVRYIASSGSQLFVNRYSMSGISNDVAKDIAVTDDNKILITGYSQLIIEAMAEECYIATMSMEWGESSELASTLNNIPGKYSLYQNYPNPFNPTTTIKFEIGASSQVKLVIYDMVGKTAAVLVNQHLDAGTHIISYTNLNLSSGIYFYELQAGTFRYVKKMTLIK